MADQLIALTLQQGAQVWVNAAQIKMIRAAGAQGTAIHFAGEDGIGVKEDHQSVVQMVNAALRQQ
jgi:hypothetical protein